MNRRVVLAVVGGALCALLLVTVASSGTVRYAEQAPRLSYDRLAQDPPDAVVPTTVPVRDEPLDASRAELPAFASTIVKIVLVGCIALLVVWAWRNRPRLTWRRRQRGTDGFDVLADIAASVTADADAQRRALERGEPRNAIVECWLRLESLIVDAGIMRRESDTSEELVTRVLERASVDASSIIDLSSLYREARFSTHPMGEDARSDAIVALDAVHAALRNRAPAPDGSVRPAKVDGA